MMPVMDEIAEKSWVRWVAGTCQRAGCHATTFYRWDGDVYRFEHRETERTFTAKELGWPPASTLRPVTEWLVTLHG